MADLDKIYTSLEAACDAVDTWPDWKLDTLSLTRRNKRRESGEQLPKPTKEQIKIAELERVIQRERENAGRLAEALQELIDKGSWSSQDPQTVRAKTALAQHAALRSGKAELCDAALACVAGKETECR